VVALITRESREAARSSKLKRAGVLTLRDRQCPIEQSSWVDSSVELIAEMHPVSLQPV